MRAAVFEAIGRLAMVERPAPRPPEGAARVRVDACGICGTDVHIFPGEFPGAVFPLVAGHEFAGVVEATGAEVSHLRPGDQVAVDPNIYCGVCRPCRRGLGHLCRNLTALGVNMDGGFATHCVVPARQAYKVGPDLPLHLAAMTEPVSCCVHGIERAGIRPGDCVVILGAGMIGLIMLQLALFQGAACAIVSEPGPEKRAMAAQLGATHTIDPRTQGLADVVAQATGGEGADCVIECVGAESTAHQAVSLAGEASRVLFFGVAPPAVRIGISPYDIYRRELTLTGSFTNPRTFDAALALLSSGRLRVAELISHRVPLEQLAEGIELLESRRAMKVMVEPQTNQSRAS
jgi:2-desacetyl-2-hydroxyethyl bacteriochlorophyllide A dehydrogenase